MRVLIIKSNENSFERTVSEWFHNEAYIDVLLINSKLKGLQKRIKILLELSKYKILNKERYDKVIVFDNTILFIYAHLFFKNVYLWFWNTIPERRGELYRIKLSKFLKYRMYSFDEADCDCYGFKANSQFFVKTIDDSFEDIDLFFVGKDKDRYDLVRNVYEYLLDNKKHPVFQMIPDIGKEYDCYDFICDTYIDYQRVLKNVSSSKAVLDISKDGQTGMTFRAMEALYYDKKIVTNNQHYINLPFYAPDKIYIIRDGILDGLVEFIDAAPIKYDEKIKEYYSIDNWIRRFK